MSNEWDWHLLVIIWKKISTSWLPFQGIKANQPWWKEGNLWTHFWLTRQLEHTLTPKSGISSWGQAQRKHEPSGKQELILACTVWTASMAAILLPSCLLGLGSFSPMWQQWNRWEWTTLLSLPIGIHFLQLQHLPKWRRPGDATNANRKHKGRTFVFSPSSFPAHSRARRVKGKGPWW